MGLRGCLRSLDLPQGSRRTVLVFTGSCGTPAEQGGRSPPPNYRTVVPPVSSQPEWGPLVRMIDVRGRLWRITGIVLRPVQGGFGKKHDVMVILECW